MMYPIMVLSFATLVLIGMLLFLVPIFVGIFEQLGGDLPMLTQIVVSASDFLRARWYIVFPVVGLVIYGLLRAKKTEKGRRIWDAIRIRAPMGIGKVIVKIGMARFSRTLSTLVAAGVDIIRSLEITGATAGNSLIEDATVLVKERVTQGVPIAVPLAEAPIFPPMVSHMVRVGEETGELEKMLSKIADFYEDEVDSRDRQPDVDHRAADDDRRRHRRRGDHHRDVPPDVQAADADPVAAAAVLTRVLTFRARQNACT